VLVQILNRLEGIERELAKGYRMERRFDDIERAVARNGQFEKIERDLARVKESTNSLATDLKNFSVDVSSRMKDFQDANGGGAGASC
jgi:hypothetical protein